jgi:hypothetical protein
MTRRTSIRSVLSSASAILILAAGCADQSPTAVQLDPVSVSAAKSAVGSLAKVVKAGQKYEAGTYSAVITPAGGTIEFGIGSIEFPAGAVSQATQISATVDGEDLKVEFAPHGLQFNAGSEPTLTFNTVGISAPSNAAIFYVDSSGTILEGVATIVDISADSAFGRIGHFSAYTYAAP